MGWQRSLTATYVFDDDLVLTGGSIRRRLDLQGITLRFGLPCCCVGRHAVLKRRGGKDEMGRDGDRMDELGILPEGSLGTKM